MISVASIPKWDQYPLSLGAALSFARPELDARQLSSDTNQDSSNTFNTSVSFLGRSTERKKSGLCKRLGDFPPCKQDFRAAQAEQRHFLCMRVDVMWPPCRLGYNNNRSPSSGFSHF